MATALSFPTVPPRPNMRNASIVPHPRSSDVRALAPVVAQPPPDDNKTQELDPSQIEEAFAIAAAARSVPPPIPTRARDTNPEFRVALRPRAFLYARAAYFFASALALRTWRMLASEWQAALERARTM